MRKAESISHHANGLVLETRLTVYEAEMLLDIFAALLHSMGLDISVCITLSTLHSFISREFYRLKRFER